MDIFLLSSIISLFFLPLSKTARYRLKGPLNPKHPSLYFHDVIEKEVLIHTQRKSFRGFENAELRDHCSFYAKTENFDFVLLHLTVGE